jgi:hypothetical protein
LRRAEQQDCLNAWGVRRKSLFEETAQQMTQRAEPAQDGSGQSAGQGAVAIGQSGQARVCILAGEELVERYTPPQNPVEKIGGNSSSGEAGNFRLWGSARARHTRIVAAKLCPRRETSAKNTSNAQL